MQFSKIRYLVSFVFVSSILAGGILFGPGFAQQTKSTAPEIPLAIPSRFATASQNGITPAGSTNWAGYVVKGPAGKISSVKMSWIVPAVSCSLLVETYSVNWVGIDGAGTNTVEQIGTTSNCGLLGASYSAWYEFYPNGMVSISEPVSPGDKMSAQVSYSSSIELYTLKLSDHTHVWAFQTTGTVSGAQDATAEWVIERPTLCDIFGICNLASLANFGTVYSGPKYTLLPNSQSDVATISGKTGSIGSFASVSGDSVYSVTMYSSNSPTYSLASPSALQNGRSFATVWDAAN